jgi:hypothetical protein
MSKRYSVGASAIVCGTLALASASLLVTSSASFAAAKGHTLATPVAASAKPGTPASVKAPKAEARGAAPAKAKAAEVVGDPLDRSAFAKATPEDDGACLTARKKLWVEGEGWIVRRITTCR